MALTTTFSVGLRMVESADIDFGDPSSRVTYQQQVALASGTGLNQADMRWSDQRTLTQGTNEDIDLAGVLSGALGGTLTFAKLKGMLIYSLTTNVVNLTLSRPAANGVPFFSAASDAIVLTPGAFFAWCDPSLAAVAVTAGTGDLINIAAAGGASDLVYDIHIFGTSA